MPAPDVIPADADGGSPAQGIALAVLLSIPLWVAIGFAASRLAGW